MTLEKHRKGQYELHLESRLVRIEQNIQMMACLLRQTLPTMPNIDVLANGGSFGITGEGNQLSGWSLLFGRGPRFVSKYNLAETDEERQALLDSLPVPAALQGTYGWNEVDYFREYRLALTHGNDYYNNRPGMAKEWKAFVADIKNHSTFETFTGTLEQYLETLPPELTSFADLKIVELTEGEKCYTRLFLPLVKDKGYLVLELVYMTGNGPTETQLRNYKTVVWSPHENCWCVLDSPLCTTEDYYAILERFALSLEYPAYEAVTHEALKQTFDDLALKIQTDWLPIIDKEFHGEMLVELEGKIVLRIRVPKPANYGDWDFYFKPLDIEEDNVSFVWLKAAKDKSRYSSQVKPLIDRSSDVSYAKIPPRQWARLVGLLNELMTAPSAEFKLVPAID